MSALPALSSSRTVRLLPTLVVSLCMGIGLAQAQTQTAPAKPTAKPAAAPAKKTAAAPAAEGKTLGGLGGASAPDGAPRRGLLDRDELRVCLKEEATIRARLEEAEKMRVALNTEKTTIEAERAALKQERDTLDAARAGPAVTELQARVKAYSARVEALNKRVVDANEAKKTGTAAERERKAMEEERAALEKERPLIDADRVSVESKLRDDVKAYNDRAVQVDARSTDWNRRNAEANDGLQALEGDRKTWVATCANRRYREEDEIAIRQGK